MAASRPFAGMAAPYIPVDGPVTATTTTATTTTTASGAPVPPPRPDVPLERKLQDEEERYQDPAYFGAYGNLSIHLEMLRDHYRTLTYKKAIDSAALEGKVVMDVGCGTGILSIFCAKAGAKKVYAIEASDMASNAEVIVARNGLSHIVEIVRGRVEEIELPERVDVIVSEWMGCFLVCESMIESVVLARERFLKPGGLMLPSKARLYMAACDVSEYYNSKTSFFRDVYGVDMSSLVPFAKNEFFNSVVLDQTVKADVVISQEPHTVVWDFDMSTMTVADLEKLNTPLKMTLAANRTFHGFVTWWDTTFLSFRADAEPVVLSTHMNNPATHWCQDLFLFDTPVTVGAQPMPLKGILCIYRDRYWRRHFNMEFSINVGGEHDIFKSFNK